MPELRKRKTPPPGPPKPAKKEKKPKSEQTAKGASDTVPEPEAKSKPVSADQDKKTAKSGPPQVGDEIELNGFGGEIETHGGEKTTLQKLVDQSKSGVVLFTYPKASTPGCTTQACLFRDSYAPLTATGLSIFGLSTDSPKSNTTFKTKQNLPYALLCDKAATLIGAIGFKKGEKTQRGVFVITKDGKVLANEAGGPAATVEVVQGIVKQLGGTDAKGEKDLEKAKANATAAEGDDAEKGKKAADVASEVADTAAKLDG